MLDLFFQTVLRHAVKAVMNKRRHRLDRVLDAFKIGIQILRARLRRQMKQLVRVISAKIPDGNHADGRGNTDGHQNRTEIQECKFRSNGIHTADILLYPCFRWSMTSGEYNKA